MHAPRRAAPSACSSSRTTATPRSARCLSAAIHANVVHNTIIHGARRDSSGTSGEVLGLAITHEVCNALRLAARVRA